MKQRSSYINSAELRQWGFCPRQWYYYRVTGKRPAYSSGMKRGIEYHERKAHHVSSIIQTQKALGLVLKTGGLVCLFYLCFYLFWSFFT